MRICFKIKTLRVLFGLSLMVWIGLIALFVATPCPRLNYNAKGIILNLIGVLITFVFAFPQESFSEGVSIDLGGQTRIPFEDGVITVDEFNALQRAKAKEHKRMSYLGLSYLLSGFGFQLFYELFK